MDAIAVIGLIVFVAWEITVEHRCASVSITQTLRWAVLPFFAAFVVSIPLGGTALLIALACASGFIMVLEILLAFNVVPSSNSYRTLLYQLPLDLRILAMNGSEVYQSAMAQRLDSATLLNLVKAAKGEERGVAVAFDIPSQPNLRFRPYALRAGVAVLTEDVSELNDLRLKLERQRDQLMAQNEMLARNQEMSKFLYRQRRERELGERLERDLADATCEIALILDECTNSPRANDVQERARLMNHAKVLVAYCKRKGIIALLGAESPAVSSDRLELVAQETAADLRSIDIECAMFTEYRGFVSVSAAGALYDAFYDCVESAVTRPDPVILGHLEQLDDGRLEMRVNIECALGLESQEGEALAAVPEIASSASGRQAAQAFVAIELEQRLSARGGDYEVWLEDGVVCMRMRVRGAEPAEAAS